MNPKIWMTLGLTATSVGAFVAAWQLGAGSPPQVPAPSQAISAPAAAAATAPLTAQPPLAAPAVVAPLAVTPQPAPTRETPPEFDVARVEKDGSTVVAGRATPGSRVTLLVDGQPAATAQADASGQFVILPQALAPGQRSLALRSQIGERATDSVQAVSVLGADKTSEAPLVALTAPGTATRIISEPSQDAQALVTRIRTVEAEQGGAFYASGLAVPGRMVRLYLNGSLVAETPARPDGGWSVRIEKGMTPGAYAVRADAIARDGKVAGRAEVAFEYPQQPQQTAAARPESAPAPAGASAPAPGGAPTQPFAQTPQGGPAPSTAPVAVAQPEPATRPADASVPEIQTATVSPGDSLWRISAKIYGAGRRYTEIYSANSDQIRNPDLIYPGQVFVAPGAGAKPDG